MKNQILNQTIHALAVKAAEKQINKDEATAEIQTRFTTGELKLYARENRITHRRDQSLRDAVVERFTNLVHDFSM